MESIGDAQGFSGKTPITPSRGFGVETLTRVTPSWKTKLNRSISTVEDGIPGWLQHCHEMCCEKGSCYGRRACMITPQRCNFQMGRLAYNKYTRRSNSRSLIRQWSYRISDEFRVCKKAEV